MTTIEILLGYFVTIAAFSLFAVGITGSSPSPVILLLGLATALFFGWAFSGAVLLLSVLRWSDGTGEVMLFFMLTAALQWAWLAHVERSYRRLRGEGFAACWRTALTSLAASLLCGLALSSALASSPRDSRLAWGLYSLITLGGLAWASFIRRRAKRVGE